MLSQSGAGVEYGKLSQAAAVALGNLIKMTGCSPKPETPDRYWCDMP
jgi:hypothetical protein